MKRINLLLALSLIISFTSCKKHKTTETEGEFASGVFVVNEGNFGQGNAGISFADKDFSKVTNNVFETVNNLALGDQAQSIGFSNGKAYIVVTGSSKIEVVEDDTMERVATISSGLTNPRYFEPIGEHTALVTCWGDPMDDTDDYLAIVNTNNDVVSGHISVGLGPEKMVKNDDYLFVAHKGAWSTNNKVTVYDLVLRQVVNTITVGDRPNSMVVKDGYLWVLCSGEPDWTGNETAGQLFKIDLNNNFNIETTFDFDTTAHPDFLSVSGNDLYYYLNGKIYKMNTGDTTLPNQEFMTYNGMAYNMEIFDDKLYITDALDYQQEGSVSVYDLSDGHLINQKTVGIIPGDLGFHFE